MTKREYREMLTKQEYLEALAKLDKIWSGRTPTWTKEIEQLVVDIEAYEDEHYPIVDQSASLKAAFNKPDEDGK